MTIRAVIFGIGETLLDDTREFGAWADWPGVPAAAWSGGFGRWWWKVHRGTRGHLHAKKGVTLSPPKGSPCKTLTSANVTAG